MSEAGSADVRRTGALILGLCLVAGSTFIVLASFNYMLTPMLNDLGLSSEQGNLALKIPSLASLLVVFVAGRIGDRIGHRRVIITLSFSFILGCAIVGVAQNLGMIVVGMFVEAISATSIQIVVVGLLVAHFIEPKSRAAAFATYGVAYPAVYLIFPVCAGWLVTYASWRLIPMMWVIGGVVVLASALFLLPRATHREPVGEMWTPVLAGLFAVGVVQSISHVSDFGLWSAPALVSIAVSIVALLLVTVLYRRFADPSLSIAPLKNGATSIILVVVLLVPVLNTFFYITIALEYMYGLSAFQTALYMVPAQAAGIVGAKFLAGPLMERFGLKWSGVALLAALGLVMLTTLDFSGQTPVIRLVIYGCFFGTAVTASGVVVLNALMSSGPADEGGNTAAYEGSAVEVGAALGVVLMSALVFGVGQLSLENGLTSSGLSSDDAAQVMDDMQANSTSPELSSSYSYPLPDGADANDVQKQAIADGLRANGVAGAVITFAAAALFAAHRRPLGDEVPVESEQAHSGGGEKL